MASDLLRRREVKTTVWARNGGLLTVGGFGDSNANPPPNASAATLGSRTDDELYDLRPFVDDGDTTITVVTRNPSDDDNIFFAALNLRGATALVGEGIVLSPTDATLSVGDQHSVIATLQDDAGRPVPNRPVTFTITQGPNAGRTFVAATDADGNAQFSYTSQIAGSDRIQASFINSQGLTLVSNIAVSNWIALPVLANFVVDDGTPQRSMVRSLTVTFQDPVVVDADAFQLNLPDGVQPAVLSVTPPLGTGVPAQTFTVTFSGSGINGNSLEDGLYSLSALESKVHNILGRNMVADATQPFFRLFGDFSGDGIDDNLDLAYFRLALTGSSQYIQYFDYNGDGSITSFDTSQVLSRRYKRIFSQDTTPPVIAFTAPLPGGTVSTNPSVTGRVTDDLSGVVSIEGQLDNGSFFSVPFDAPTGTFSFVTSLPLDGSADGQHAVHLRARDRAGNVSIVYDNSFVLDTTAPVITYISPAPGTATRSNPLVSGQVTDVLSDVVSLQAQVDDGLIFAVPFDATGAFSFTTALAVNGTDDGPHTVHLFARDSLGNVSGPFNLSFLLDTTPPLLTYTSPIDGVHTRLNPTVSGQVTDSLSGLATLLGQFDAGPMFPVDLDAFGNFTFVTGLALDGSADGPHTVLLTATDKAANLTALEVSFVLDTTPPVVTYTSPTPDQVLQTDATIAGQVTDVLSEINLLQGQIDGGPTFPVAVDQNGAFSFASRLALDGSADGPHTVRLQATDEPGNVSTSFELSFVLDTTPVAMDPYLAQAVRQTLGLPPNQNITDAVLAQLTTLTADSNQVASLAGLEFATNLESLRLIPSDWSDPGQLSSLVQLSGLPNLRELVLQQTGIDDSELATLGSPPAVETLDLRYNLLTDVSVVAGLPGLSSLLVYGNPVVNLSALAGKLIDLDLASSGIARASSVADVASAEFRLPERLFEFVHNEIEFQPYAGVMRGAEATLLARAGNAWDTAALMEALLEEAGLAVRIVTGQTEVPIDDAMAWLGARSADGAASMLGYAGLNPVTLLGFGGEPIAIRFDHAWVETDVTDASGVHTVKLDASWKFKERQPGAENLLTLVPFDEAEYLARPRTESTHEFYEEQVRTYLAANSPGLSLADVSYDGPIRPMIFNDLPSSLPYTILGTPVSFDAIPANMQHRVQLKLAAGLGTQFDVTLAVPDVALDSLVVGWNDLGSQVVPQLFLGDTIIASGAAIAERSSVTLTIAHLDPGDNIVDRSFNYQRFAGQWIGVGIDGGQFTDSQIVQLQLRVNDAAIDALNGVSVAPARQIGGLLALAVGKWFHETDHGGEVIAGLTNAQPIYVRVASGITTGEPVVDYFADLQNPFVPRGLNIDIANNFSQLVALDGSTTGDAARGVLTGYNDSAAEHEIWEELVNTDSISTIKSLQLAGERNIPIFTITSANASTLLPQLTIDSSTRNAIASEVSAGATVTVPRPHPAQRLEGSRLHHAQTRRQRGLHHLRWPEFRRRAVAVGQLSGRQRLGGSEYRSHLRPGYGRVGAVLRGRSGQYRKRKRETRRNRLAHSQSRCRAGVLAPLRLEERIGHRDGCRLVF